MKSGREGLGNKWLTFSETDILHLIASDEWMMEALRAVASLKLTDWWVGAGFVRNFVWDYLHGFERSELNDIDVIYFDGRNTSEDEEKRYEAELRSVMGVPWSVKNQARMAEVRGDGPYKDACDGLSRWVETATCVGVGIDDEGKLSLCAPCGLGDLVNLQLRYNCKSGVERKVFLDRVKSKRWLERWPKLELVGEE